MPVASLPATLCAAAFLAGAASACRADAPQEQTAAPARCDQQEHHQLDFWVGDWQVFDTGKNTLVAVDHVEKQYEGCVVLETLTFLTDLYRRPGIPVRLSGIAVNRFDGERWLQMWADNQWGAIVLRGAPDKEGHMEFVTVVPSRNRDVRLVYENHADGSLRILQYVAPAGSGKWVKYGDLSYRRNR
jgi:hypothetical protein